MERYQPFTLSVIFRFIFLGCAHFVLRFYIIMSIIVTDIEFLMARITDGFDSPSVTKTATRIGLEIIDLCYTSLVDL